MAIAPITLDEIRAAATRVADVVRDTPLVPWHDPSGEASLLLKLEIHQPVTSFKIRGVYNAALAVPAERRRPGLLTVSAGNTAQALAFAARRLGVPARSLMPADAPPAKIEAVRRYGGTPVLVPRAALFAFLEEEGWRGEPEAFIHPWTNRDLLVGHGTLALELARQQPDLAEVFVPVGGGGLLGGVGSALRALLPGCRIVAVEPEGCAALHESLRRGAPARVPCRTICDGVAVPLITDEIFPLLRDVVDDVVLVSDERVRETIRRLALGNRVVVEPAGALAVAAALTASTNGPAAAIVSGGSIDPGLLAELLS
jgi:threonine dehydratase